jgi:hypothetical protein
MCSPPELTAISAAVRAHLDDPVPFAFPAALR